MIAGLHFGVSPDGTAIGGVAAIAAPVLYFYFRILKSQGSRIVVVERRLRRCERDRQILLVLAQRAGLAIPPDFFDDDDKAD